MKKATLLLNLGSPDSTKVSDVRKYLKEFLMDGRVLDAPKPIRSLIVNAFILPFRPKKSAEAYESIWDPNGSPLILMSEKLQQLAQEGVDTPVYLAMRYGNPSIKSVLEKIANDGIEKLQIFPLYPHYAMSSYETVVVEVMDQILANHPQIQTELVQPFYDEEDYIDALVETAKPYLEQDYDHLVFSYHGIPERHLRKSDPSHAHCLKTPDCCLTCNPAHATCYKHHGVRTTHLFVEKAGIPKDKYSITYQSRLGRDPWLTPYTDKTLEEYGKKGIKKLLIICPAFVSDCLETLEEISEEGKEIFLEAGGDSFQQIPCLNDHPSWVKFVQKKINNFSQQED